MSNTEHNANSKTKLQHLTKIITSQLELNQAHVLLYRNSFCYGQSVFKVKLLSFCYGQNVFKVKLLNVQKIKNHKNDDTFLFIGTSKFWVEAGCFKFFTNFQPHLFLKFFEE